MKRNSKKNIQIGDLITILKDCKDEPIFWRFSTDEERNLLNPPGIKGMITIDILKYDSIYLLLSKIYDHHTDEIEVEILDPIDNKIVKSYLKFFKKFQ